MRRGEVESTTEVGNRRRVCSNVERRTTALRWLHERGIVSVYAEARGRRRRKAKFLRYSAEDRAARRDNDNADGNVGSASKKNEPKVQSADFYAKMAISSSKSPRRRRPSNPVSDLQAT